MTGRAKMPTAVERRDALHRAEVQLRRAMEAVDGALRVDADLREREACGVPIRSWRGQLENLALAIRARRVERL